MNAFLVILLLLSQLAFQIKLYTVAFCLLLLKLLVVIFLKERQRVFIWLVAGLLLSQLVMLYADRFLASSQLTLELSLVAHRFLWFIPLMVLMYIKKSFRLKQNATVYSFI